MTTATVPAFSGQPVDDRGRLVHEDDLVAQLALALVRLEDALAALHLRPAALVAVRVLTTDPAAARSSLDVLAERFAVVGTHPTTTVVAVDALALPGMLVALEGDVDPDADQREVPMSTTLHRSTRPTDQTSAAALRGLCPGRVHLPGDPGYDAARVPWNLAVDQRPAAVAVPHSVAEVAAVVTAAAAAGLRVAPQSTGHAAGPLAARGLDDVVLLRLHELTGVTVDAERRVARVVGGTLWRDVVDAAAQHGLAALHGSSPDVAVAGYVLGGGLSFYARRHGLACHSLVAAEVVLADGTLVRASAQEEPELFWALRGGGGNLGVVVALELALLPVPDVHAGMLLWPAERAAEVVHAWARLTRSAPESMTTSLRLMSFPPLPDLPPFLSGRRIVVVDGAVLEDDATAAALLAPLRDLAPEMDTFGRMPAAGLLGVHMDPPGPTPAVSDTAVLSHLDDAAVEALLAAVGPDSPLLFAELRHLGGALSREPDGAGVLARLEGDYLLFAVGVAPTPEAADVARAAAADVVRALAPWSTASRVLNFAESAVETSSGHEPEAWARLGAVRDRVDPARTVVANHPL